MRSVVKLILDYFEMNDFWLRLSMITSYCLHRWPSWSYTCHFGVFFGYGGIGTPFISLVKVYLRYSSVSNSSFSTTAYTIPVRPTNTNNVSSVSHLMLFKRSIEFTHKCSYAVHRFSSTILQNHFSFNVSSTFMIWTSLTPISCIENFWMQVSTWSSSWVPYFGRQTTSIASPYLCSKVVVWS